MRMLNKDKTKKYNSPKITKTLKCPHKNLYKSTVKYYGQFNAMNIRTV